MRAPYFWSAGLDPKSREAAPLTRLMLRPARALYLMGLRRRLRNTVPAQAGIPVICIGNLTAGGAGKTPITEAIRNRIIAAGYRAASLSRGHGGRLKGPLAVDPAVHSARETGDEPLVLAASGEAWIGRDRAAAAKAMRVAGVAAIIMDDGHQNPTLHKDLSLVVIDAAAPFGNGEILPCGPLREPVAEGLARADGIILMGEGDVPAAVSASGKPVLRARLVSAAPPPEGPLVAFAGIARPQRFFDMLAAEGAVLCDAVPFADHHAFSAGELRFLKRLAGDHGARLITTAKDHVRLPPEIRAGVLVHRVTVSFDTPDALDALVLPLLKHPHP